LCSLRPMLTDTALEQRSTVLAKMWSIHVDDVVPVVFVNTLVDCFITWTRLQVLVTVRSFSWSDSLMKTSQYSGPQESRPLHHIHYQAFHTHWDTGYRLDHVLLYDLIL
jgi:hypothetical protein